MVIIAKQSGEEIRAVKYNEYDFEVGDEANDFEVKILREEWEDIPQDALIYIPDTEYGGIVKRIEVDTKQGYISLGGLTWRGMLKSKIIQPPEGEDYAADEGDVNTIISYRVEDAFEGFMTGSPPIGVYADYRYNRYVSLYDGLQAMLKRVGYRLRIIYNNSLKRVVVDAVPIVDYSGQIEFSTDINAYIYINLDRTGVNHLICLGSGRLKDRIVVHLYADADGNISREQTFKGKDEITQVYDYAGADETQLVQSGTEQLEQMQSINQFSIDIEAESIEIGDIVGGKDFVTGISMKAPVTGKIHRSSNGLVTTEYTISNNVEVKQ